MDLPYDECYTHLSSLTRRGSPARCWAHLVLMCSLALTRTRPPCLRGRIHVCGRLTLGDLTVGKQTVVTLTLNTALRWWQ